MVVISFKNSVENRAIGKFSTSEISVLRFANPRNISSK